MSTLTRTNSHSNKKPQYKDYVSFLDSYRNNNNNKKDDQISVTDSGVNFSLNSSLNNSSNSVFSDTSEKLPPKPVKTVKTEMFIEIKNPQTYPTHVFEVKQEPLMSVSNAAKIFESKDLKSNKKSSIEEISRKFQASGKPKRAASIGEVSKIFENKQPKNFNAVPKPFQPSIIKPAISPKPFLTQPIFPKFAEQQKSSNYPDSVDSALSSLSISPSPPQCSSPPLIGGPLSPPPIPPPLPPANFTASKPKITVQSNNNVTLDRNDPRVKKAVYGALRNMYGAYHDQANDYLATLPKNRVKKNNGLDSIIDSIAQARLPCLGADFGHSLPSTGHHQPTVKLKTKNSSSKMDPPACVQNAMMTKDKKPFTYTPGGIDLSEVRSPRMQRRIERNANLGGASDNVPKPPQAQNVGPLPPAALAAMRPQTQVQVFPGPPPAPPMQKNIPPPPPPPTCPLPTQKVQTGVEVVERPDMTKIIPENPMALLRKTGGPAPRKSLIDQLYEQPPSPPQRNLEPLERPQQVSTPIQPQSPKQNQFQPQYQPAPVPQPQYQPAPVPQPQYQLQPPAPVSQVQYQPRSPESPKVPSYQPPIIERQPTMPKHEGPAQRNINNNVVSSNVGSLYIPPLNQQQQKMVSPPTPPERTQAQMQSPILREAPRPWQQRNVQPELPAWVKQDNVEAPNVQQRWAPQPSNNNPGHVQVEIRSVPFQPQEPEERKPNAVYVTQPIILQHPGTVEPPYKGPKQQQTRIEPPYQGSQQQYRLQQNQTRIVESSGTRIIPIQIEGRTPPATPGNERSLNRQLSWGTQPTQSNSFKVIQKFTRTDDEEDDDTPVTQHSARYPQEMPEQMRRMKINDNNNEHFRQGHQQNNVVRQNEQPYVHPSEQVVPEPKKYMGSNIPSRSFKILQAMTAPTENCAKANYNEESPYNNINNNVYSPYPYPYYPPPYWPTDYYANFHQSEQNMNKNCEKAGINYFYPQEQSDSTSKMSDKSSKSSKSGRSTPLPPLMPFWPYMPPPPRKSENCLRPQTPKNEESYHYPPIYPPYYDPYFYSYYYGYPPMMPYPFYHPPTQENEEFSGYSSTDEMANYNNSRRSSLSRRNSFDNGHTTSVQALRQQFESRSKSVTPRITVTPTYENVASENYSQENICNVRPDKTTKEDIEVPNNLRSIKSVQNIHIYATNCEDSDNSSESEATSSDEAENNEDDQLSVIYEESERGESRRSFRCSSVASEATTTINENNSEEDEEEDDFLARQNVKYKINLFQETSEQFSLKKLGENKLKIFKEETETFAKINIQKNAEKEESECMNCDEKDYDNNINCKVTTEQDKEEHNEDWWGVIKNDNERNKEETKANECDKKNEEIKSEEYAMGEVKLRKKNTEVDFIKSAKNSVYDELNEENKITSSGTLMRVDSFASQLEAIKRNSGLWKFEDILSNNSENIIKEEVTDDSESEEEDKEEISNKPEIANSSEESEIDFWSQIKTEDDDDDFRPKRRIYYLNKEESNAIIDSANSSSSSCSKSQEEATENEIQPEINRKSRSKSLEPQTIKERIEALHNSFEENNIKNKNEIPTSKTISTKSSMKSFDECSEEELDSGVISDISRHISDNEEFPELRKMTRYERAATHSRLFKLLQDECDNIEEEDKFSKLSVRQSRSKLSLNLTNNNVNEKLVEELVQSLLKSKKAHIFKNMPKEKLYAAAVTILQENIEEDSEEFSSLLSPYTQSSTPAQTPQEFYQDNGYKQYYDSWSDAAVDIMPSKAFKLLQDHLGANKCLAKCPKISSDCSLFLNSPQSNDVTNT